MTYKIHNNGQSLIYVKIKHKRWIYQLTRNYHITTDIIIHETIKTKYITLNTSGSLIIFNGYAWNGANKPAINTKTNILAFLVHNTLCQLIRSGKLSFRFRKNADKIFYKICLESGMIPIRAWWSFKAVQLYAIVIKWNKRFRRD